MSRPLSAGKGAIKGTDRLVESLRCTGNSLSFTSADIFCNRSLDCAAGRYLSDRPRRFSGVASEHFKQPVGLPDCAASGTFRGIKRIANELGLRIAGADTARSVAKPGFGTNLSAFSNTGGTCESFVHARDCSGSIRKAIGYDIIHVIKRSLCRTGIDIPATRQRFKRATNIGDFLDRNTPVLPQPSGSGHAANNGLNFGIRNLHNCTVSIDRNSRYQVVYRTYGNLVIKRRHDRACFLTAQTLQCFRTTNSLCSGSSIFRCGSSPSGSQAPCNFLFCLLHPGASDLPHTRMRSTADFLKALRKHLCRLVAHVGVRTYYIFQNALLIGRIQQFVNCRFHTGLRTGLDCAPLQFFRGSISKATNDSLHGR